MAKVPFSSILAKDTFLQSLALDDSICPPNNGSDELFLINHLSHSFFPPSQPSASSFQHHFTNANVESSISNNNYQDAALYNEYYKHVPTNIENNANISKRNEGHRKRAPLRSDTFDEKAMLLEIQTLTEHVRSLEESNAKLQGKLSTQELWASGQRKYVKDLVQQLKTKDEMVEELKASLAKKDATKEKSEKTNISHEWQQEKKRMKQLHAQEVRALQEKIKNAQESAVTEEQNTHKQTKKVKELEDKIEGMQKEIYLISQKLTKEESSNATLEAKASKTQKHYDELSHFCKNLCAQIAQLESSNSEMTLKIMELSKFVS